MSFNQGGVPSGTEWGPVVGPTLDSCEVSTVGTLHTGITTTETDITKMVLGPVSLVSGDLYRVDVRLILLNSVATDEFVARIRKGTALTGTLMAELPIYRSSTTAQYVYSGWANWPCSTTESKAIYVSLLRVAGSGNTQVYGQANTQSRSGATIRRVGYSAAHRVVP